MTTNPSEPRRYTLLAPHFSEAPLVAELSHLTLVADAIVEDRIDALVDLFVSGRIVTLSPFERVTVLEDALTAVRVATADGSGRSGWVPSSWLRPADAHAAAWARQGAA